MVGTPADMSPEIINHQGQENNIDVYTLGITFHEMCYFNIPRKLAQTFGPEGITMKFEDVPAQNNVNLYSKDIYNLIHLMLEKEPNKRLKSQYVFNFIKKMYNSKARNNLTIDGVYGCLFSFK